MWEHTQEGVARKFETRGKEEVIVEIKTKQGIAVIKYPNYEQVIGWIRDNKVKIWNDLLFDPVTYHQIKSQMTALCVKKETASNKNATKRR
ncbi:hypothetical protein [Turicibacter sanguinis]|uniref:hypothetical protein n=1 Tax=Turicibacter sanguinis TaxID=154288 RepID=UPI003999EFCB